MKDSGWLEYERTVRNAFAAQYRDATVRHDVRLRGLRSGIERQIDVLIEQKSGDLTHVTAVEAKYYNRRIDVKEVEAFIGQLRDIEVTRGVMVSPLGYSAAALSRAFRDDVDLDLDILSLAELIRLQSFGAIVYSGSHGAIIPAPLGWIVEPDPSHNTLARAYRRGLQFDTAIQIPEFMYVNICGRDQTIPDLDALLAKQERDILATDPGAVISVNYAAARNGVRTCVRRAEIAKYPSAEITGMVEFERFILFIVLFTPLTVERRNVRKLEHLMGTLKPMNVIRNPGRG